MNVQTPSVPECADPAAPDRVRTMTCGTKLGHCFSAVASSAVTVLTRSREFRAEPDLMAFISSEKTGVFRWVHDGARMYAHNGKY